MSSNFKNEYWTVTAGDLSSKRYRIEAPEYSNTPTNDVYKIVVDQSVKYQDWIGVGAAITDASAKLIWNQTANQRRDLLEELFRLKRVISLLFEFQLVLAIFLAKITIHTMTCHLVATTMISNISPLEKVSRVPQTLPKT